MSLFDPILAQQAQIAALGPRLVALRDTLIGAPAIPQDAGEQMIAAPSLYSGIVGDLENAGINSRAALNAVEAVLADLEKAFS